MRLFLVCTLLFPSFILISGKYLSSETQELKYQKCYPPTDGFSIYNYSVTQLNGNQVIRFEAFKEKALLFVNVATYCKCAQQQYTELNALKTFFGGEHFEIIAVPCNQFGKLEPSTKASEILNGLKYVRPGNGFEPNFILTERIDVNGASGHLMYDFMKRSCPATRTKFNKDVFYEPFHERDIRWNFEKILIEPNTGYPVKRYDSAVSPRNLVRDIQQLLVTSKNVAPVYSENRFQSHFGNITNTFLKA